MNVEDLIDEARALLYDEYSATAATGRMLYTQEELSIWMKRSVERITAKTDYNVYNSYYTIATTAITSISSATQAVITVPSANIGQFEKGSFIRLVDMADDFEDYDNSVYTILSVDTSGYTVTIDLDSTLLTFTTGNFIPSIFPLSSFSSQTLHTIYSVICFNDNYSSVYELVKTSWGFVISTNPLSSGNMPVGYYIRGTNLYLQNAPVEDSIFSIEGRWSVTYPTAVASDYPILDVDAEDVSVWWTVAMGYFKVANEKMYIAAMQHYNDAFEKFKDKARKLIRDDTLLARPNKRLQ